MDTQDQLASLLTQVIERLDAQDARIDALTGGNQPETKPESKPRATRKPAGGRKRTSTRKPKTRTNDDGWILVTQAKVTQARNIMRETKRGSDERRQRKAKANLGHVYGLSVKDCDTLLAGGHVTMGATAKYPEGKTLVIG